MQINIPVKIEDINCIKHVIKPCYVLYNANSINKINIANFAEKLLHANEQAIMARRKNITAKKEYIASRFLIKSYIAQHQNIPYQALQLRFDKESTKLQAVVNDKVLPLTIALSHSKGWILFGVSNDTINIAVDIEYNNTQRDVKPLVTAYFHKSEVNSLLSDEDNKFYSLWCLKEALAKITGQSVLSVLGKNTKQQLIPYFYTTEQYQNFTFAVIQTIALTPQCFYLIEDEKELQ